MKSLLLVVLALVLGLSSPVADISPTQEDYSHYLLSLKRLLWRDNRDDTIRAVHDYLVLTVDYSHKDEGTAYQAIVEKESNCKGYSEAFRDLLSLWNFDCEVVYGIYENGLHSWNYVKFSDGWYYVDVTLDDTGDGLISMLYYKQEELETHYQIYKEEEE